MRYNNSVVTEEDFKKERERRDNQLLDRFKGRINSKWLAYVNGFDSDYSATPITGMNE
jgi:hypothetical protein